MAHRPTAADRLRESWAGNLRARRTALGLTQAQVAERAGHPQGTISELERGRFRSLTPETMLRLAVALDVDPARLFGFPPGVADLAAFELDAEVAA